MEADKNFDGELSFEEFKEAVAPILYERMEFVPKKDDAFREGVLVPDAHDALRLAGDQWRPIALPDDAQQVGRRDLCAVDDAMWLVWQGESGQARRWKRVSDAWKEMPLSLPATAVALRGGTRMTAVVGDPRMVGRVEMGVFQGLVPAPSDATVLPWGDGFAAVRVRGAQVDWAECAAGADGFSPWSELAEQRSVAGRWFHVPVLGVLSLGALMLAFLVRSVAGDAAPTVSLVIMPKATANVVSFMIKGVAVMPMPMSTAFTGPVAASKMRIA
jgi:hypothetical protein